ncbi:MAG: ATP-binding protein [Eubacterium sp.]
MKRLLKKDIVNWMQNGRTALLLTGARQTGKTYLIRECLQEADLPSIEINFIRDREILNLFQNADNADDILRRMSLVYGKQMIPGKTIIFLDEVQEDKNILTDMKFLVEDGRYRYVMSGSLLGIELTDLRSAPVGYLQVLDLYPMNLEEYFLALGMPDQTMEMIQECFEKRKPVDDFIHKKLINAYYLYLITGGMPQALKTYLETENLEKTQDIQRAIIRMYDQDFTKYEKNDRHRLRLREIYDAAPSELSEKNKRFQLNHLGSGMSYDRTENSFLWLKDAGVVLPVYNVTQPTIPLLSSTKRNLFKLFLSDVGLLTAQYSTETRIRILNQDAAVNNGGLFENAVAQELFSHGYRVWYFNSKKQGEIDLMIEQGERALPIEVKSGKDYTRHSALNNILADKNYQIPEAIVFSSGNVSVQGKIVYLPIYMSGCIRRKQLANPYYHLDLSGLW